MPYCGHLIEVTWHLKWAPSKELQAAPLASEIPKWGTKLALSERKKKKKDSNLMDVQAVARLHCVRTPREKNVYFAL